MSVKVSIILTAFNSESTIEDAVRAILNQTYTNFELIIVNDASTDYTLTILKGLQRQDERIRLITTSVNYGTYVCKNYGMKISTGEYFMFHDADDYCTPSYITASISFLRENPKVKVCYQNCVVNQESLKNPRIEWTEKHWWGINSISSCFSRNVLEEIGYFDSVRFGADSEMMCRLMCVYGDGVVLLTHTKPYTVVKTEGSLTCSTTTNIKSRSRRVYEDNSYLFHKSIIEKKINPYMEFPLTQRPFEVDKISSIGKAVDLSTFKEIKENSVLSVPLTKWLEYNPKWKRLSSSTTPKKRMTVSFNMATVPQRYKTAIKTIDSIYNQADIIRIYLNGFDEIPDRFIRDKIVIHQGEDLKAAGKLFWASNENEYYFCIDDDFYYPPTYTSDMISKLNNYDDNAIISLHGRILNSGKISSYFKDSQVLHYKEERSCTTPVHVIGTGVCLFNTNKLKIDYKDFKYHHMTDICTSIEAQKQNIPAFVTAHPKDYIKYLEPNGPTLYKTYCDNDSTQTEMINSIEWRLIEKDTTSRDNLVFTSAGDDTFFDELWLDKNRNYDVWVTYYGDNDEIYEKYKSKVDYIEKRKGSKFQNFHHVYTTKNLSKYKRFFILDDDIIISTEEINKMFKISEEASLWICQPSFDHKSKLGWIINKHRKEYYLRYTNFVEVNTPLFTKGALSKLMDHYSPELVEFGVDYLYIWANGLEERKKYAIIDTVQCHNPHNADGEGDKLSQHGMSIEDRVKVWEEYRKELNIPHWEHKTHQYIPWTKMQIELTKADFSTVVDVKFNEKLSIPSSTEDKIALLFLTRNNLKHPKLWYDFINDAKGKCNIYAHTKEKNIITQDFLKEAQIPTHVDTQWGDYSLIKAANEMIRSALKDPTNKFFVLLCESSIPLHKFGPIYQFLFKNQKSILYTKITPPDKKELEKICKQVINHEQLNLTKNTITRNSQWMIITREHAEIIGKHNHEEAFKNFPIADEWYHYNVLQYYDKDFSTKVLNFKPTYFQYDLKDIKDPLPHPIEVKDKTLIMDVKKNYLSLFFRKVSPTVTVEYQEL